MNDNEEQTDFEQALSRSLQQSCDELPEATMTALNHRRALALASKPAQRWQWPSALAASVLVGMLVFQQLTPNASVTEADLVYWQVEPDLLETMDMLAVLSELP